MEKKLGYNMFWSKKVKQTIEKEAKVYKNDKLILTVLGCHRAALVSNAP